MYLFIWNFLEFKTSQVRTFDVSRLMFDVCPLWVVANRFPVSCLKLDVSHLTFDVSRLMSLVNAATYTTLNRIVIVQECDATGAA